MLDTCIAWLLTLHGRAALLPKTTYTVTVSAQNSVGFSTAGAASSPFTTPEKAPDPPRDLAVDSITSTSAIASWLPPLDSGSNPIAGYQIFLYAYQSPFPIPPRASYQRSYRILSRQVGRQLQQILFQGVHFFVCRRYAAISPAMQHAICLANSALLAAHNLPWPQT
jgi:hypothetical protein